MDKGILSGQELQPGGRRLGRDFFCRDAITVARELLGKILVHETSVGTIRGMITETESYMGEEDKGSHTYGGKRTQRTEPMYHQGGTSYVYLIYGMYSCMNIAAMTEDIPQAVLIRSVEPADELSRERMEILRVCEQESRQERRQEREQTSRQEHEQERRQEHEQTSRQEHKQKGKVVPVSAAIRKHLADGPGKLCIAMEITRQDNDIDMVESDRFYVTEGITVLPEQIREGKRIGIDYAEEAADYLWRFYL